VAEQAEALGAAAQVRAGGAGSDHVPFMELGVPAVLLIWFDVQNPDSYYHRPADLPATIELEKLEQAGKAALGALLELARP
jgi:Zn-dependent M28 family amino/carboxypeptidase